MAYTTLQQAVDDITVKNQTLTDEVLAADTKSTTDKNAAVTAKTAAEAAEQGAIDARDLASQHKDAAALSDTNAGNAQTQAEAQVPLAVAEGDRAVAARDAAVLTALGPDNDRLASVASVYGMPSLNLDFAKQEFWKQGTYPWNQQTLDPNLDLIVQRASTKWVFDATGTLVEVPIDTLAFDHDPVTGEPLGVLIEESRTNLLPYSANFSNLVWEKRNCVVAQDQGGYRITVDTTVGGQGTGIIDTLVLATVATNKTYTASIVVKKGNFSSLRFSTQTNSYQPYAVIDLDTETVDLTGDDNMYPMSVSIADAEDGFKKIDVTFTHSEGNWDVSRKSAFYIGPHLGADGDYFFIKRAQLEEGTFPTSYIPTAGAAVTRAADDISWTVGDELNRRNNTLLLQFDTLSVPEPSQGILGSDRFELNPALAAGSAKLYLDSRVVDGNITASTYTVAGETRHTIAISYNGTSVETWANGIRALTAQVDGLYADLSKLLFFSRHGSSYHMHVNIRRFYGFPRAMTAAELQEVTTL